MKHSIPHGLSQEVARRATRRALESYRERFSEYAPEGEWLDDDTATVSFKVVGRTLEGRVQVRGDHIDLELDVPLIFRPFRGAAIKVIEAEIHKWLQKASEGEI